MKNTASCTAECKDGVLCVHKLQNGIDNLNNRFYLKRHDREYRVLHLDDFNHYQTCTVRDYDKCSGCTRLITYGLFVKPSV
jgi:hypothetical protein